MARYARRPASGLPRPRGPWKHGPVAVIGLIGGIGAGKSQVAARLAELGALVLDADAVGHALIDQAPAREQVVRRFGAQYLLPSAEPDGLPRVNRRALGELVFSQPAARRDLEAILHPRMRRTFERAIDRAVRAGRVRAVVLDAAVLFEAGWNDLCDTVVFVDAPKDLRLARLAAQRGWTAETLEAREKAQLSLDEKSRRSDHLIANDTDLEALHAAVDRFWQTLDKPARTAPAAPRTSRPAAPRGGPPRANRPARRP